MTTPDIITPLHFKAPALFNDALSPLWYKFGMVWLPHWKTMVPVTRTHGRLYRGVISYSYRAIRITRPETGDSYYI